MSELTYRLLERLQRLDDALRLAQHRRKTDPGEIARLHILKGVIKQRLMRLGGQRPSLRRAPAFTLA